jgi:hypothetical protein
MSPDRRMRPSPWSSSVISSVRIAVARTLPCPAFGASWAIAQRSRAARHLTSVRNLAEGAREHQRIATHATRAQRLLVLVMIALLAAVLIQLVTSTGVIRP